MGVRTANVQPGNIGETLEGLAATIHARRDASPETSYTARLLTDVEDELLKKIAEEASEVIMACKDDDHDHIRYEVGRPRLSPARDPRALRRDPRRARRRAQCPHEVGKRPQRTQYQSPQRTQFPNYPRSRVLKLVT